MAKNKKNEAGFIFSEPGLQKLQILLFYRNVQNKGAAYKFKIYCGC